MIGSLLSYVQDRLPMGNSLQGVSSQKLEEFMQQSQAPEWHSYAVSSRQ